MSESVPKRSPLWAFGSFLLWVVLPLLLGVAAAWRAVPRPAVGLVRLEDVVWSGSAADVAAQLNYARRERAIRAVVFLVSSPGGEVSASETLYLEVLRTRREMPVVGVTGDLAASGAYYAIVAADYIYTNPSSILGNIGVVSSLPIDTFVEEDYMATGPFKLFGSSREDYVRYMNSMKESFLNSVVTQRGDRLRVDRAELSRGQIYLGMNALQLGLIDEIGTVGDAAAKAAEMARIHDYRIVDIPSAMEREGVQSYPYESKRVSELPDGFYYLYTGPR
jgi:protease-4